jgi:hypothetical protein
MKFARQQQVAIVTTLFCGAAWALEYLFLLPAMTYNQDVDVEFAGRRTK